METATAYLEEGSSTQLTLTVNKASGFVRYSLAALAVTAFLMPIISSIYAVFFGEGPHVAYLFILLGFGYFGVYLLKTYLWNSYGMEEMVFSNQEFKYVVSFRYFVGPIKRLEYPYYLNYTVVWENDSQVEAILSIYNENGVVNSTLKLPIEEVEKVYIKLCDEIPWLRGIDAEADGLHAMQAF